MCLASFSLPLCPYLSLLMLMDYSIPVQDHQSTVPDPRRNLAGAGDDDVNHRNHVGGFGARHQLHGTMLSIGSPSIIAGVYSGKVPAKLRHHSVNGSMSACEEGDDYARKVISMRNRGILMKRVMIILDKNNSKNNIVDARLDGEGTEERFGDVYENLDRLPRLACLWSVLKA